MLAIDDDYTVCRRANIRYSMLDIVYNQMIVKQTETGIVLALLPAKSMATNPKTGK